MNLPLKPEAIRIAEILMKEDHRPSIVNTIENLLFKEAERLGLKKKQKANKAIGSGLNQ